MQPREGGGAMAEGVTRLIQGGVTSAQGFVAAGVHCGIKAQKKDLALVVSRVPAAAAGVFTTNKVKAAPVLLDMERVRSGQGQAVLLNSGNANACTGEQGMRDAREMARLAGEHLQMVEDLVYICSTGPIGVPLPMDAVRRGIPEAVRHLGADGTAAAEAILTTDTVSKTGAVQVTVGSQVVTVGGMSKGAGMIHPQMATTLSVLTTDASVAPAVLNSALRRAALGADHGRGRLLRRGRGAGPNRGENRPGRGRGARRRRGRAGAPRGGRRASGGGERAGDGGSRRGARGSDRLDLRSLGGVCQGKCRGAFLRWLAGAA